MLEIKIFVPGQRGIEDRTVKGYVHVRADGVLEIYPEGEEFLSIVYAHGAWASYTTKKVKEVEN